MPTRINTKQLNKNNNNVNRSISNNNDSTNQRKDDNDWETNVGRLTGEINDGKALNFSLGEWKQIFTQHQATPRQRLPQGQHKKDKQQQRAVQWRKKQDYRRQGEEIRKASKNMKSSSTNLVSPTKN